jgi:hypothetical protein
MRGGSYIGYREGKGLRERGMEEAQRERGRKEEREREKRHTWNSN